MKPSSMILKGLSGLMLIVCGVLCFVFPYDTVGWLSFVLGAMLIASGITTIAAFTGGGMLVLGAGWVFLDGIVTILLGVTCMVTNGFIADLFPVLFGLWAMVTGFIRVIRSFDFRAFGLNKWWCVALSGAVLIILGAVALGLTREASAVILAVITGIFLIVEGIGEFVDLFYSLKRARKMQDISSRIKKVREEIITPPTEFTEVDDVIEKHPDEK